MTGATVDRGQLAAFESGIRTLCPRGWSLLPARQRVSDASPMQTVVGGFTNPRRFLGTTPAAAGPSPATGIRPKSSDQDRTVAIASASAVANEQALDVFICSMQTQYAFTDKVVSADKMGVAHYSGALDLCYVGLTS